MEIAYDEFKAFGTREIMEVFFPLLLALID